MNYRRKANMALAISVLFFCICVVLRYFYKEIFLFKLLLFVSEASLVGGVADWFAVTALFRKPLGFPYHTEIIPRNRKAITNATANLVETDLLNREAVKRQIESISVMEYIVKYVDENQAVRTKCLGKLTAIAQRYIEEKGLKEIAVYIEKVIKEEGKNINVSDQLKNFVENKFTYENRAKWVQKFLNTLSEEEGNEKLLAFCEKLLMGNEEESGFSLNSLLQKLNISVAEDLAAVIKSQLQNILTELMQEESALSQACVKSLVKSLEGLELSPASIEQWKVDLLEKAELKPIIEAQLPLLIKEATLSAVIEKLWDSFKENATIANAIDSGIKEILYKVLEKKHNVVGSIARDTLNNFTDERLNAFVEEKAGEDLQWIRINGSVLGGCIGLVLFVFLNLIFEPYIAPVVRGILSFMG